MNVVDLKMDDTQTNPSEDTAMNHPKARVNSMQILPVNLLIVNYS